MYKFIFTVMLLFSFVMHPAYADDQYISDIHWHNYIMELNESIQKFSGITGIVVKDLSSGKSYAYNADKKFISASLIKLPIMVGVFKEFIDGNISLTDTCILENKYRIGGSGVLKHQKTGTEYTLYELVYTMIAKSDNTAARMLTEQIGYDAINTTLRELGLQNTNISPRSFNLSDDEIAGDSYTTPRDIALLLEKIYDEQLFRRYVSKQMIDILKLPTSNNRLRRYLPKKFSLAHKTGLLRGACHDAGLIFSPSGDYLLCVFTNANGNYYTAKQFIADTGKHLYNFIQGTNPAKKIRQ